MHKARYTFHIAARGRPAALTCARSVRFGRACAWEFPEHSALFYISRRNQRHCSTSTSETFASSSLRGLLAAGDERRFFFIGGKGGVGKTTVAASLGVGLARAGHKTLVVSTDPAHSLGDALAMDLKGKPVPVLLDGPGWPGFKDSAGSLHAMEIDPTEVIGQFRDKLNLESLAATLADKSAGLGTGFMNALLKAGVDVNAFVSLLECSPPGIDEAVALAHMMQLLHNDEANKFERIVIDTAPTGHTLRLLAFPKFLHGLIGALLSMYQQVSSFNAIGMVLGKVVGDDLQEQLKVTKRNLERLMSSMSTLNSVLTNVDATSFIMVAIPTHLAVSESRRLLKALEEARTPAQHVIVNQCPSVDSSGDRDVLCKVQATLAKLEGLQTIDATALKALKRTIGRLQRQHQEAEQQIALLKEKVGPQVNVLCMPTFEEELTGVGPLEQYSKALFAL